MEEVRKKYKRRINRYLELKNNKKRIFHIFNNTELNDWQYQQYRLANIRFNDYNQDELQEKVKGTEIRLFNLKQLENQLKFPNKEFSV